MKNNPSALVRALAFMLRPAVMLILRNEHLAQPELGPPDTGKRPYYPAYQPVVHDPDSPYPLMGDPKLPAPKDSITCSTDSFGAILARLRMADVTRPELNDRRNDRRRSKT